MRKKDKLTPKDIYKNYWHCRDFELTNLWQRSVFLAAFLLLIYTGYGALLREIANCLDIRNTCPDKYEFLNLCGVGLSILGMIFSVLWIMMSKGSKAWYERYERAIEIMEEDKGFRDKLPEKMYSFGYIDEEKEKRPEINNSLISGKGGRYSPSKINIAIGQISFIIWIILTIVHSVLIIISSDYCSHWICALIVLIILFLVFLKDALSPNWLKSSSIEENR
ncbi:RipA family octameric membrane protein [Bacteroides ihuae]|uniref:RipA family octameric membrane protein n=1 Tax=Bacteroides ihuae TaxID=1852362 RepID=UPI0008D9142B|nr:hypothetical protein [Bacteroides ihuae]